MGESLLPSKYFFCGLKFCPVLAVNKDAIKQLTAFSFKFPSTKIPNMSGQGHQPMTLITPLQVNYNRFIGSIMLQPQNYVFEVQIKNKDIIWDQKPTELSYNLMNIFQITFFLADNNIPDSFRDFSIIIPNTITYESSAPICIDKTIAMADTEKIHMLTHQDLVPFQFLDVCLLFFFFLSNW